MSTVDNPTVASVFDDCSNTTTAIENDNLCRPPGKNDKVKTSGNRDQNNSFEMKKISVTRAIVKIIKSGNLTLGA